MRVPAPVIQFRVFGVAQQMGSKRAFVPKGWTRPVITDSNRNLKSWQQLVADAAHTALLAMPEPERRLLTGGVRLLIACYLPRPASLPRRVTVHTKAPDLDKLVRGIGDALSNVIYADDRQVIDLIARKRYALPGDVPYVDIRVESAIGGDTVPINSPLFDVL